MNNLSNIVKLEQDITILKNIIMEIPCHVYWTDIEGVYLGCNNLQAKFLGFNSADDIIGKKLEDILVSKDKDNVINMINDINNIVLQGEMVEKEEIILLEKKSLCFYQRKDLYMICKIKLLVLLVYQLILLIVNKKKI